MPRAGSDAWKKGKAGNSEKPRGGIRKKWERIEVTERMHGVPASVVHFESFSADTG